VNKHFDCHIFFSLPNLSQPKIETLQRAGKWLNAAAASMLVLTMPLAHSAPTNLITNGGFEVGTLSGWTQTNVRYGGVDASGPHSGVYAYDPLNGSGDGTETISQTFSDTAGSILTVSAWVNAYAILPTDFYTIAFNGVSLVTKLGSPANDAGYIQYSFQVVGTGSDTINLSSIATPGPGHTFFDDISVTQAVPEPGTYAMLLTGLGLLGFAARRSRVAE
jgi:hypothetical protein